MTRGGDCLPLPQVLAPGYFFLDQRHHGIVGSRGDGAVNCRDGRRMLHYGVEKRVCRQASTRACAACSKRISSSVAKSLLANGFSGALLTFDAAWSFSEAYSGAL
jgi:hypothetical protein